MPGGRSNFELVAASLGQLGDEDLPHAGRHQLAHWVRAAVPPIEITDDADALRVRSPHGEVNAREAVNGQSPAAKLLPGPIVRPFREQMEVEVPQNLTKPIWIDEFPQRAALVHAKAIEEIPRRPSVRIDEQLEQAV